MSDSRRRPWLILGICCLSLLIVGTDSTIVNVALPAIRRELHASLSGLQWSVDTYTLVIGSLLMASGSMADRFGRRRVFQIGLVVFTLGSLLCSLAWSVTAASHAAWILLAACGLGIAGLGFVSTGRRASATAQRVREILAGEASDGVSGSASNGALASAAGVGPGAGTEDGHGAVDAA